jgi:hypothetical protein
MKNQRHVYVDDREIFNFGSFQECFASLSLIPIEIIIEKIGFQNSLSIPKDNSPVILNCLQEKQNNNEQLLNKNLGFIDTS